MNLSKKQEIKMSRKDFSKTENPAMAFISTASESKETKEKSKKARNQENKKSKYIKFAGLIRDDLKKEFSVFCIKNDLREYKALEQALEQYLRSNKEK
jgi:hypothetical protein